MFKQITISFFFIFFFQIANSQYSLSGIVTKEGEAIEYATVTIKEINEEKLTNENGYFRFLKISPGTYRLAVNIIGYQPKEQLVVIDDQNISVNINFSEADASVLETVLVEANNGQDVSGRLGDVSGTAIYAGKKTQLIHLKNLNVNLASNNTRQIYARVPGLNIWEYDRGGLQLGIGGRGLSPNRSSNFNIRQNGYDISADALGYPESYYTPSSEAIERIEIVRGAASLQYGPHFGGLINFVMKEGPKLKKAEITSRQTIGNNGFFNSFNSVGGTVAKGKLNYYSFYQFKKGDSWRPNSHFDQHSAYAHIAYQFTNKLKITGQYTFMNYLAQQPGGLTDAQFKEDPSVSVRARNWFKVDWNLISLSLDYAFNKNTKLNWRSYTLQGGRDALGQLTYINRPDDGQTRDYLSDVYNNFGSELRVIHQYPLFKEQTSTLLVGARLYKGLTNRKQGNGNNGSGPDFEYLGTEPDKLSYRFPGTNVAAFAENIFKINPQWTVTPGFRFEYIDTKADGYYYERRVFIDDEKKYETRSSPRSFLLLGIGTAWKLNSGGEVYANISQNYRSINFNDIRVQNENARVDSLLKDETGYNIDLGFRDYFNKWLYADISLFYLKYNGRIGSVFASDEDYMIYRLRTNVSDSRNIGVEFLLDGDILKALYGSASKYKLNLYTALSVIDAKYISSKQAAYDNKLVENVPPFTLRAGTSFGNARYNISFQYAHQAKQYSDATNAEETPTAVDGAIPAFSVMDLSFKYGWRAFTLFAGLNNLADKKYFTRRADGYPGPGIIPADRRSFYLTLQFKW